MWLWLWLWLFSRFCTAVASTIHDESRVLKLSSSHRCLIVLVLFGVGSLTFVCPPLPCHLAARLAALESSEDDFDAMLAEDQKDKDVNSDSASTSDEPEQEATPLQLEVQVRTESNKKEEFVPVPLFEEPLIARKPTFSHIAKVGTSCCFHGMSWHCKLSSMLVLAVALTRINICPCSSHIILLLSRFVSSVLLHCMVSRRTPYRCHIACNASTSQPDERPLPEFVQSLPSQFTDTFGAQAGKKHANADPQRQLDIHLTGTISRCRHNTYRYCTYRYIVRYIDYGHMPSARELRVRVWLHVYT